MIPNRNVLFISLFDLNLFLLWLHFQLFGFGHSSLVLGHNFGWPLLLYPSTYISYELICLTLYLPWLKHARAVKLSKTVLSHNVYYWSATPILLFIKIIVFSIVTSLDHLNTIISSTLICCLLSVLLCSLFLIYCPTFFSVRRRRSHHRLIKCTF